MYPLRRVESLGVWESFIHPEGLLYWSKASTDIPGLNIITESDVTDGRTLERVTFSANRLLKRATEEGIIKDTPDRANSSLAHAPNIDLVIVELKPDPEEDYDFGYYFVDHSAYQIFWLDKFESEEYGIVVCDENHLGKWCRRYYFCHGHTNNI